MSQSNERLVTSVYSDASVRHGAAGYAVTVVPKSGKPMHASGYLETSNNVQAEIDSLAIGIAFAPPCDRLIVYTDLVELPD